MKTPAEKLLDVTFGTSSAEVALLIADKLIFYCKSDVYRFRIDHDTRPPRCLACPMEYDWVLKDHVGIETKVKANARKWLTVAALRGYKIDEVDLKHNPVGRTESIEHVRKRAEYHQRSKENDDDIPF